MPAIKPTSKPFRMSDNHLTSQQCVSQTNIQHLASQPSSKLARNTIKQFTIQPFSKAPCF